MRRRLPAEEAAAILDDARALAEAAIPHAGPDGNRMRDPCDPVGLAQAQEQARIRIREAWLEGWLDSRSCPSRRCACRCGGEGGAGTQAVCRAAAASTGSASSPAGPCTCGLVGLSVRLGARQS